LARQPSCLPYRQRDGVAAVAFSRLGSANVIRGNRRAASASVRETGRAAYTVLR